MLLQLSRASDEVTPDLLEITCRTYVISAINDCMFPQHDSILILDNEMMRIRTRQKCAVKNGLGISGLQFIQLNIAL